MCMKKCLRSAHDFFNNKKKLHTLLKLIILRNTATPDTEKHMGAEEPLHFLTKTDLANHKKRKITETETGMET